MALSTKKKNIIIAEFKAGKYESKTLLAKAHRINRTTLYKLLEEIDKNDTSIPQIIEAGVAYESAKKATRNPHEIKVIEEQVALRVNTQEIDNKLMMNSRKMAMVVLKRINDEKEDIDINNAKNVTSALKDIESIANPQLKSQVNVQQNNTNQVKEIEVKFI